MKWWKYFLEAAVPLTEMAGRAKENEDADDIGTDDLIGQTLVFLAQLGRWVLAGGVGQAPATPPILQSKQKGGL